MSLNNFEAGANEKLTSRGDPTGPPGELGPTRPNQDPVNGRFLPGNQSGLVHGARRSFDQPDLASALASKRTALLGHLGEASVIQADLAEDYARVAVLVDTVWSNLEAAGILTPKGKRRAATTLLLSLIDKRLKLAQALGVERRTKQVDLARALSGLDR